jgi:hypothetical protein
MLKIPYGESNFRTMMERHYFYQDRTSFIQTLENYSSKYLVYLRPRRFGKSLFLSTLRHYYGINYKKDFNNLFGQTFIGQNPTPEANNYLMLHLDFSGINTANYDTTLEGFLRNVQSGVIAFLTDYASYFTVEQAKDVLNQKEPHLVIKSLFDVWNKNNIDKKIYVIIDEYDHFANEIISFNFKDFTNIVSKNGFVRKFYETIKTVTIEGIVDRLFITGVSPITLDSMTSGFNISTNITLTHEFHNMMGFVEAEVRGILEKIDVPSEKLDTVLSDVKDWYNGYLFSAEIPNLQRVYNPNMVLYFAQKYQSIKDYPKELLDVNIATDYSKIRRLFKIDDKETDAVLALKELMEKDEIVSPLVSQYSFERGFSNKDLISLLFYMGFLTIKNEELGAYSFIFPNYVIKKLYADYLFAFVREENALPIDNKNVNEAIRNLATTGNPTLFFNEMTLILKSLSPRDAKDFNENTLKAIVVSLLHQQTFYYVHSEYPSKHFYMDIFLEAIRGYKPNYEVAFEFKYLKKGQAKALETTIADATTQLEAYLKTPLFKGKTTVKAWVVVVVNNKIHAKMVR